MHWMDTSSIDTTLLATVGLTVLLASIISGTLLIIYSKKHPADPAQLTNTIVQRSWSGQQVILMLGGFVGMALLLSFIQPVVAHSDQPAARLIPVLIFSAAQVALLVMIGRHRQRGWNVDFGMHLPQLKLLPVSLAVYLAMLPALGIITQMYHTYLQRVFGIDPDMQEVAQLITDSHSWTRVGFILLAVVVAPLYEELIFRGVFFSFLVRRIGLGGALIGVSTVFALIHFHIPSLLPLFLLSIVLCLTYWRTGSLWANIGVHALFNGVTTLVLLMM